jgi:hypothetical protein
MGRSAGREPEDGVLRDPVEDPIPGEQESLAIDRALGDVGVGRGDSHSSLGELAA